MHIASVSEKKYVGLVDCGGKTQLQPKQSFVAANFFFRPSKAKISTYIFVIAQNRGEIKQHVSQKICLKFTMIMRMSEEKYQFMIMNTRCDRIVYYYMCSSSTLPKRRRFIKQKGEKEHGFVV